MTKDEFMNVLDLIIRWVPSVVWRIRLYEVDVVPLQFLKRQWVTNRSKSKEDWSDKSFSYGYASSSIWKWLLKHRNWDIGEQLPVNLVQDACKRNPNLALLPCSWDKIVSSSGYSLRKHGFLPHKETRSHPHPCPPPRPHKEKGWQQVINSWTNPSSILHWCIWSVRLCEILHKIYLFLSFFYQVISFYLLNR